jgi:hypothetical protein
MEGVFPYEVTSYDLAGKLTPLRSRPRGVLDSVPTLFVSVKQFVYTDPPLSDLNIVLLFMFGQASRVSGHSQYCFPVLNKERECTPLPALTT